MTLLASNKIDKELLVLKSEKLPSYYDNFDETLPFTPRF